MWYVITNDDISSDPQALKKARPAHVARLMELKNQGRLLVAGPFPAIDSEVPGEAGYSGSMVIAEFDNIETAQAWANAEPYLELRAYSLVSVKPFRKVLP